MTRITRFRYRSSWKEERERERKFLRKIIVSRRLLQSSGSENGGENFAAAVRFRRFRGNNFVDKREKKKRPPLLSPRLASPRPASPPRRRRGGRGEPSRSVRCRAISKIQARPLPQRQRFSGLLCNAVISPNCRCKKQFAIDVSED